VAPRKRRPRGPKAQAPYTWSPGRPFCAVVATKRSRADDGRLAHDWRGVSWFAGVFSGPAEASALAWYAQRLRPRQPRQQKPRPSGAFVMGRAGIEPATLGLKVPHVNRAGTSRGEWVSRGVRLAAPALDLGVSGRLGGGSALADRSRLVGVVGSAVLTAPTLSAADECSRLARTGQPGLGRLCLRQADARQPRVGERRAPLE
jgi:hypothetical protein